MAQVLTTSAKVTCGPAPPHGGGALLSSTSKLSVSGTKVLVESGVGQLVNPVCPNSGNPPTPDLTITISGGQSQKLMSDGSPVLLSTLTGLGSGAPQGAISASESQQKLVAS